MKKLTTLLIMAILVSGFNSEVKAQENGINGLIFGAGGGALIGQAIGRNTESTLIGTAVGSMLGYVIGNERDKNGTFQVQSTYQPVQRVYSIPARPYYRETYVPATRYQERVCRETEVLGTVNGHPERIFGTACLENGQWVMEADGIKIRQTIIVADDDRGHYRKRGGIKFREARQHRDQIYYRTGW